MMMAHLVLYIWAGLLIVILSLPMAQGHTTPNAAYGLRVKETLADERVWHAANRLCGRDGIILGILLIVLAIGLAVPLWSRADLYTNLQQGIIAVGILVWGVRSKLAARRIQAELKRKDQAEG